MGIEGLGAFIKKKQPDSIHVVSKDAFKNISVALDFGNMEYAGMSIVFSRLIGKMDLIYNGVDDKITNQAFLKFMLDYIMEFLKMGINPVIVFDGKFPAEKSCKHSKKKEEREKLYKEIAGYQLLGQRSQDKAVVQSCHDELVKRCKRLVYVSPEINKCLKHILMDMGLQVVQAEGEAEKTCAILYHNKTVSAVYSTDTDCLVYGVNHMISSNKDNPSTFIFKSAYEIITNFNMEYHQFIDFCILCGCDYNTHIFRCGPQKSYDAIMQYKYIEYATQHIKCNEEDLKNLNHVKCRELFNIDVNEKIEVPEKNIKSAEEYGLETMNMYNMGHMYQPMMTILKINS